MGTTTIIGMLNAELGHSPEGVTTDALNTKNDLVLKLMKALEAHASAELKILKDESRSQSGKLAALAKLGTETAPSLKWMKNVIQDLEATDKGYRKRFFSIDPGITDVAERMPILSYLWNRLDGLDRNALNIRFLLAAEQDQAAIMSAMLTNPEGSMVDGDVKERALATRAQRLFPQQYDNFEQNQILLEFLVMTRDWIGRWLNQEVGVEIPVIRTNLGDAIADALQQQTTGLTHPDTQPQLAGASK